MKRICICGADISEFGIVLPGNPSATETTARAELREHIQKAAGFVLPDGPGKTGRGIYIGRAVKHPRDGIEYDGYVIETDHLNLYLYGGIDRGTLYAVFAFLEKHVGFRKYEPAVGRLLPGDCIVEAGQRDVSNPAFDFRRSDWKSHAEDAAFNAWERMNTWELPGCDRYGGILKSVGWCHTFEALCDPKLYFDTHPEYYSLIDGVRIPAGNEFDKPYGQLCLTNPDVLKIVIESVKKRLSENPGARVVEVSQNDNCNYCRCDSCAAVDEEEGSPSGLMLRFVNAVADAIQDEYPDVLVRTFAYQYTRVPPKITKPGKNVVIRYCTIEACFRHVLDEGCEMNAGKYGPELREWSSICDKISIWDYTTNYAGFLAPFPNFEVLRPNARFFAENNAKQVFEEDTPRSYSGDLGSLKAYLVARLLWNPYMSEEEYQAHTDDFLEGFYGAGWKNVREYMRLIHDATADRHIGCFAPVDIGSRGYDPDNEAYIPEAYQEICEDTYLTDFIQNHLEEAKRLWAETEALAADDGERDRARRSSLAVTYLDLFCRRHDRECMNEAQRQAYEAEVKRFFKDKERFEMNVNLWTWRHGR